MKLDSKAMRHLTDDDWRVLAAAEQGSKNHELVPTPLIEKLSTSSVGGGAVRGGSGQVRRSISALAKVGLIAKVKEAKYDGYRLTYGGLDYLALHGHARRGDVYSVGERVGVGKESDIMVVSDHAGAQKILKMHRLGRISFRSVRSNRDYLRGNRKHAGSWMYLSRLAAEKEFAFMRALRGEGFPVPLPIAQNRHTILMELIDAFPMRQVTRVGDPAALYADLMQMILRLAAHGLIHGDFNEFNILLKEVAEEAEPRDGASDPPESSSSSAPPPSSISPETPSAEPKLTVVPILIDFPQMVSMEHRNAEMYFDRDVACIKRFFQRRFGFVSDKKGPHFRDALKTVGKDGARRLDDTAKASGFTKKKLEDLEQAIESQSQARGDGEGEAEYSDDDDDDDDDDEDNEEEEEEEDGSVGHEDADPSASDAPRIAMEKLQLGNQP